MAGVTAGERFVLFPSMGEYDAYDDGVYDSFDAPDDRVRAYREAIEASVAGKVVLDIGTGRDALWAVHAARGGARHVYAVERQPSAAGQARRAVARAGLAGRVTVIEGLSTGVELPERAHVCVSEIVGNIASSEGAVVALADARRRLCAADCVWIPFRIQTWAAAVDLSGVDLALAAESLPYLRRVFAGVGHPFDVRLCLGGPVGERMISTAATVESIVFDRRREPPPEEARGAADLTVTGHDVRMTGVLLWTRVAVTSGSAEVDALTSDTRGWAPIYVPLSAEGRTVRRGDNLRVTFHRQTSDDGVHPDYHLTVESPRLEWASPHHGRGFRRSPLHRRLLPEAG